MVFPGETQTARGKVKETCHIEGAWGCDRALGNDGLMALRYFAAATALVGAVPGVAGRTRPYQPSLSRLRPSAPVGDSGMPR